MYFIPQLFWRGDYIIKMSSYQYRNSHYKDKIVSWLSHLYYGNSYGVYKTSLHWISPLNMILVNDHYFLQLSHNMHN